jgi:predicted PurR-regulated permease PerM
MHIFKKNGKTFWRDINRKGAACMKKSSSRHIVWLITYVGVLILILIYFREILYVIGKALGWFQSFFLGVVIAFILNHTYEKVRELYRKLQLKEKYTGVASIATVYLTLIAGIGALIWIILPQLMENVTELLLHLDEYRMKLQKIMNMLTRIFHTEQVDVTVLFRFLQKYTGNVDDVIQRALPQITDTTKSVLSGTVTIGAALVFSIYLLSGKERILSQIKRVFRVLLSENTYKVSGYLSAIAIRTFDNYVAGQSIEAAILGGLCFVGMVLLRIEYAGMISVLVAVTALVPILGAYIGGGIAVLLLLVTSTEKAFVFLVFFVILQQVENNLIYPRVVGKKIGLPGIWVLLGITVGAKAWGIPGMLFGVPVLTVLYTVSKQMVLIVEEWRRMQS